MYRDSHDPPVCDELQCPTVCIYYEKQFRSCLLLWIDDVMRSTLAALPQVWKSPNSRAKPRSRLYYSGWVTIQILFTYHSRLYSYNSVFGEDGWPMLSRFIFEGVRSLRKRLYCIYVIFIPYIMSPVVSLYIDTVWKSNNIVLPRKLHLQSGAVPCSNEHQRLNTHTQHLFVKSRYSLFHLHVNISDT